MKRCHTKLKQLLRNCQNMKKLQICRFLILRNRTRAASMHTRCASQEPPVPHFEGRGDSGTPWGRNRSLWDAIAMQLPCSCHAIFGLATAATARFAAQLPCSCHAVAMQLPCNCHAVAMQYLALPLQPQQDSLRSCHAVAMQLPCTCHEVAMQLPCTCHEFHVHL